MVLLYLKTTRPVARNITNFGRTVRNDSTKMLDSQGSREGYLGNGAARYVLPV